MYKKLSHLLVVLILVSVTLARADVYKYECPEGIEGLPIKKITITIKDIFDESNTGWLYQAGNKLKINTHEEVVRRELLFAEGDPAICFRLQETERILRTLGSLRKVNITATKEGDGVSVVVFVQDTWTFVPQISYSTGSGKQSSAIGISDSNLAGWGNRAELLYREDDGRNSLEGVYVDPRISGTDYNLITAYLDRNDGEIALASFGRPLRSLLDKDAWNIDIDHGNTISRFFDEGDESYIFRQKRNVSNARYTWVHGNPEIATQRYSLGYSYSDFRFYQATADDYNDVNLDPSQVSNDPDRVAENRRFSGPQVTYEHLEPFFVSKMYVDRFSLEQDFNLGPAFFFNTQVAPEMLGSLDDAVLFSSNFSIGKLLENEAFIRAEIGYSGRLQTAEGFVNNLPRAQVKYYNVLGLKRLGGLSLGHHTLAAAFSLDYGYKLDKDREFSLGADNALRGYTAHSFNGNRAMVLNIEDRVHIAEDIFKLLDVGAAGFIDVGGVTNSSIGSLIGDDLYGNVGIGLRLGFPRSSGGKVVRMDIAAPIRDGPDGTPSLEFRVIFAGGNLFDGYLRSEQVGAERANISVGFDR